VHDFALHSILSGAADASQLGRAMSVTKQAAARTISILEERGYVAREPDEADRRRMRLQVTERGLAMLHEGEAIFDEIRDRWAEQVGVESIGALENALRLLVGDNVVRLDSPGWSARDLEG
jgi:DNA-binding MarR family transcriptional regulator